jgi:Uma2 family endonuclease
VIEVLSPRPRIGDVAERLEWFRDYGVRECWLVGQLERRIRVVQFDAGGEVLRQTFSADERIVSLVLPELALSPAPVFGY